MTYRPIINVSSMSRGYGYTAGGNTYGIGIRVTTERYDDIANAWTYRSDLSIATGYINGFSLNGFGYGAGGTTGSYITTTHKYDDTANIWSIKGNLNNGDNFSACFSFNNYGYIMGGNANVVEKYDDLDDTWTVKTSLNTGNHSLSGFSLNRYGYAVGGETTPVSAATQKYDDIADTWTNKTNLGTANTALSGFSFNGYGYTAGGLYNITEKYDDLIDSWTVKTALNSSRYGLNAFSLNGYGYTVGGYSSKTDVEKYDDIANTWTAKAGINAGRYGVAAFAIGSLQADIKNPELIPIYKVLNRRASPDANGRLPTALVSTCIPNYYWHASWDERTSVAGTWIQAADEHQTNYDPLLMVVAGSVQNPTGAADNDEIHFGNLVLTAGTYKVIVSFIKFNGCGILEVLHGTTSIGTQDEYNASTLYNQVVSFTYSPTILVSGNLRVKCSGRNASGNNYIIFISRLEIIRTG